MAAFAGCAGDSGETTTTRVSTDDPRVGVETVASGFVSPVDVAVGGGETFVADQPGRLHRVGEGGATDVALDLRDAIVSLSGYEERGLLGVALHPDFPETPRLYVRYSAPRRDGTPEDYSHTFVLAEFTRTGGAFDRGSERTVLEIPQPQSNHNAGSVVFGPAGYLYVGVGDGGGSGDSGRGHADDWYGANAGGNGQDTDANRLGSILRIDVDERGAGKPYGVPTENPLPDSPYPEQYAWGFRNPWRFGFDDIDSTAAGEQAETLVAADVGQNRYEEVNAVEKGGNYGWNVREGRHCYGSESCPTETPDGAPLVDPVVEYPHEGDGVSGVSVVGGSVYRGDALSALRGEYVFGDWNAQGRLFVATPDGDRWPTRVLPVDGLDPYLTAFGSDSSGELLACTSQSGGLSGTSGRVVRLVPA